MENIDTIKEWRIVVFTSVGLRASKSSASLRSINGKEEGWKIIDAENIWNSAAGKWLLPQQLCGTCWARWELSPFLNKWIINFYSRESCHRSPSWCCPAFFFSILLVSYTYWDSRTTARLKMQATKITVFLESTSQINKRNMFRRFVSEPEWQRRGS